jgi:hypothetical protein
MAFLALVAGCDNGCGSAPVADAAVEDAGEQEIVVSARLLAAEGKVAVRRSQSEEWIPATAGMALQVDDSLRTQRDAFATLQFEEGGTLRVGPESLVRITDLRLQVRSQVRRSTFTVEEGRVEAELLPLKPAGEFRIRTPSAEASLNHREVAFQ